jgi:Plasmid pRiA4b ORF-3-like protein
LGFEEVGDESAVALAQVAAEEKAKIVYVYDFGDDWRHDIVLEKITPPLPGVAYPRCTGGRGRAPEGQGLSETLRVHVSAGQHGCWVYRTGLSRDLCRVRDGGSRGSSRVTPQPSRAA